MIETQEQALAEARCVALMKYQHPCAVDDPVLDFAIFLIDSHNYSAAAFADDEKADRKQDV